MIPSMMLVGLVVGALPRPWYLVGLAIAAVGWAVLLIVGDTIEVGDQADIVGALLLALVNTAAGIGITKGATSLLRRAGIGTR